MMTKEEARAFAQEWLPAWSGNRPELLASFYAEDCVYIDDAIPEGAHGKEALLAYFSKLLAYNPEWVWTQIEAIPMEGGFLNKWQADIPVGEEVVTCIGVCLVQCNEEGKIKRNEVYFDRSKLVAKIQQHRKEKR